MKTHSDRKSGLHPRNRHQAPYDFDALCQRTPELQPFVFVNEHGTQTLDFADPTAVKALNKALLALHYGIAHWDLPVGYLCPPIPGRVDYLHRVADLLAESAGKVPTGKSVRVLDIGVGANCIYPLLGPANMAGALSAPTSIRCRSRPLPCWPRATGWAARSNAVCRAGPATSFRGLWRRASVLR